MTTPEVRTYRLRLDTWWGKLVAVALLIVVVSVAALLWTVLVFVLLAGLVAGAIAGWWRRRKGLDPAGGARSDSTPNEARVIDVDDYEVHG